MPLSFALYLALHAYFNALSANLKTQPGITLEINNRKLTIQN